MPRMQFAEAKRFLKEYSAFKKFKSEIQYNETSCYETFWDYAREEGLSEDFIENAFDWESSREGYEYWDYIDDEWREHGPY